MHIQLTKRLISKPPKYTFESTINDNSIFYLAPVTYVIRRRRKRLRRAGRTRLCYESMRPRSTQFGATPLQPRDTWQPRRCRSRRRFRAHWRSRVARPCPTKKLSASHVRHTMKCSRLRRVRCAVEDDQPACSGTEASGQGRLPPGQFQSIIPILAGGPA